jgi:hypothetical protein
MEKLQSSQLKYDALTSNFKVKEAYEISNDERLLSYGEMPFMISPLLYGETVHAGIAEIIMQV